MLRKSIIVFLSLGLFLLALEFSVRFRMSLTEVVVVKKTLQQRAAITKDDLTIKKVSRHFLSDDTITDLSEIEDHYVKMEHTLQEGNILRKSQIETLDDSIDAPSLLLHENQRVYTIKRDVASVFGSAIVRGSYVDVAVQKRSQDEYGIIIENVRVVGVRDRNGEEVTIGKTPHLVLLAIDLMDVESMLRAEDEGKVVLLPRNTHEGS
ncbi:MAG TPA: SAF domain-containing protein [Erysipelothrix sp.]|nr:SAF domain-containing protein [Erysipelothrix sp.]